MNFETLEQSVWTRLQEEARPIVLYGMGDGADKILDRFETLGITAAGVFASDEFVREHSFRGFRVKKLSEIVEELGEDIVIVIAFASQRPEVLEKMYDLDARFDVVAPDVPVVPGPVFNAAFVRAHQEELTHAYALLADELSRRVFLDTVRFKLSGRLPYLRASETGKDEIFRSVLRPNAQEHFADLGAYNGDTIRELLSYTGGAFASVTALEPDRRNFRKLSAWAEQNLSGAVRLEQAGAWSKDTVRCAFRTRPGGSPRSRIPAGRRRCARWTACWTASPAPISRWMSRARSARRSAARRRRSRSTAPSSTLQPTTAARTFSSSRSSFTRSARTTGCICGTIRMCPHGTRIYMRPVRK